MNKYDIEFERAHKVFEDAGNSEFTLKWVINFIEEWELWTGIIKNHRRMK